MEYLQLSLEAFKVLDTNLRCFLLNYRLLQVPCREPSDLFDGTLQLLTILQLIGILSHLIHFRLILLPLWNEVIPRLLRSKLVLRLLEDLDVHLIGSVLLLRIELDLLLLLKHTLPLGSLELLRLLSILVSLLA